MSGEIRDDWHDPAAKPINVPPSRGMRLTVFLVNTICRPINALFVLADRDVCRWAQDTDEDET